MPLMSMTTCISVACVVAQYFLYLALIFDWTTQNGLNIETTY